MKKVLCGVALAGGTLVSGGFLNGAYQADSVGKYTTAVAEDRLYVKNDSELRCDLTFTSSFADPWLVPKGSSVVQSVPAFVWQYAGLLPVSEYLKTVTLHGYNSEQKDRSWQDVQLAYYDGLRAEGARDFEAKIAYAGAYAFAPRWMEVEFIDITDPVKDKGSRVYEVKYNPPVIKGVSIDDYRAVVREIMDNPERVELADIRRVIDAADSGEAGISLQSAMVQIDSAPEPEIQLHPESVDGELGELVDIELAAFMTPQKVDLAEINRWEKLDDGSVLLRNVVADDQ